MKGKANSGNFMLWAGHNNDDDDEEDLSWKVNISRRCIGKVVITKNVLNEAKGIRVRVQPRRYPLYQI